MHFSLDFIYKSIWKKHTKDLSIDSICHSQNSLPKLFCCSFPAQKASSQKGCFSKIAEILIHIWDTVRAQGNSSMKSVVSNQERVIMMRVHCCFIKSRLKVG